MWAFNFSGIVETIFVGKFGEAALAAAGITNFIIYLACSLAIGIGIGVQTETAHRLGRQIQFLARPLNAGILVCLGVTAAFSALIWIVAPFLMQQFTEDPAVLAITMPFTQLKLIGLWAYSLVYIFRGYWMAIQRPIPAFLILLLTNGLVIVFDAILMFGLFGFPALGFLGAGIGFSLAGIIGSAIFIGWSWIERDHSGFFQGLPDAFDFKQVIKLGTPAGIQEGFVAIGMSLLILVFGKIGTTEQAVGNVLIQLSTLLILPAIGFGLATHSLVGEAYGKGDLAELKAWSNRIALVALAFTGVVSGMLILFSRPILGLFLSNPEAVHLAHMPFVIDLITITLFSVGIVYEYTLKGMGKMVLSLCISTCLYLLIIGPIFGMMLLNIPLSILKIWIMFALFNTAYWGVYFVAFRLTRKSVHHLAVADGTGISPIER